MAEEYNLRPTYRQKASVGVMKEIIRTILEAELSGKTYQLEMASQMTKQLADEIKNRLKDLNLPRYKYMVQVVIGEQKGQGVRMGHRCFWDSNTDSVASETFVNDSIFCAATAYAVYLY
ncbi:unnamed protein product [Heterosigma akashiwo]